MEFIVIELLQDNDALDDYGRDMVKTKCFVAGDVKVVYVQHPHDNRMIEVGYTFEM